MPHKTITMLHNCLRCLQIDDGDTRTNTVNCTMVSKLTENQSYRTPCNHTGVKWDTAQKCTICSMSPYSLGCLKAPGHTATPLTTTPIILWNVLSCFDENQNMRESSLTLMTNTHRAPGGLSPVCLYFAFYVSHSSKGELMQVSHGKCCK